MPAINTNKTPQPERRAYTSQDIHVRSTSDHDADQPLPPGAQMLFNLYTIDSCFLSSQWRITSNAAFAGSCIGVFLLTLVLELLRRSIKEYDRYLIRQHRSRHQTTSSATESTTGFATGSATPPNTKNCAAAVSSITCGKAVPPFRPNALQQGVRAFLHLLAFFVGYILMLVCFPRDYLDFSGPPSTQRRAHN